jgi:hypothetical protein
LLDRPEEELQSKQARGMKLASLKAGRDGRRPHPHRDERFTGPLSIFGTIEQEVIR